MKKYKFVFLNTKDKTWHFANKRKSEWIPYPFSEWIPHPKSNINKTYGYHQYKLKDFLYRVETGGKELSDIGGYKTNSYTEIDSLRIMLKSFKYEYNKTLKQYNELKDEPNNSAHIEYYKRVCKHKMANNRKYINDITKRIKEIEISTEYLLYLLTK